MNFTMGQKSPDELLLPQLVPPSYPCNKWPLLYRIRWIHIICRPNSNSFLTSLTFYCCSVNVFLIWKWFSPCFYGYLTVCVIFSLPLILPWLQSALSSPEESTPSLDSTTRSPWTRWPPSVVPSTLLSSRPVIQSTPTSSSSSRCARP